jgi:uncharacterized OB-fold protein
MGFERFSLCIKHTKIRDFVDYLENGKIMAKRCKGCGAKYYPPRADCAHCLGSDTEWVEIPSEGKLLTFTQIFVPPEHYASIPSPMPFSRTFLEPTPVGIIEVEEGIRIMGFIPKMDAKKIRIGMSFKALPEPLPDGSITIVLSPQEG